jgi:hypothetical protein
MAIEAQILASRRNTQKSGGPARPPMEKSTSNLNTILKKQSQFVGGINERNTLFKNDL